MPFSRLARPAALLLAALVLWAAAGAPGPVAAQPLPRPERPPAQVPSGPGQTPQAQRGGSVLSQGVMKEQHGAWRVLCEGIAGPQAERCALVQNVESAERPGFGLVVMVIKTPDGKTRMRIAAPTGIFLPPGLGLRVDGKQIGNVPFWFCSPYACETEAIVTDQLMDALSSGAEAIFVIFERPEQGTGLIVSLDGFITGHGALDVWNPPAQQSGGGPAPPPTQN